MSTRKYGSQDVEVDEVLGEVPQAGTIAETLGRDRGEVYGYRGKLGNTSTATTAAYQLTSTE